MEFHIASATDTGCTKRENQDSYYTKQLSMEIGAVAFAVLCDGMGGLEHGNVASSTIVSAFREWGDTILPTFSREDLEDCTIRRQWSALVETQNFKLRAFGKANQCRLGSTVAALLLTSERYFILNIGDTRIYEITESIRQLTEDHTLIANEVRLGNIAPDQAANAPMQNILTRCVGVNRLAEPDFFFGETSPNAVYLLCSDGFRRRISEDEIQKSMKPRRHFDREAMNAEETRLVSLNRTRGERDDITVLSVSTEEDNEEETALLEHSP